MKKKLFALVAMLLTLCMALTACGGNNTGSGNSTTNNGSNAGDTTDEGGDSAVKIAVCGGKAGSTGFTDEGIAGTDRAREELGVEIDYVECEDNAAYETNGRFLSESGEYDLIIFVNSQIGDIVSLFCDEYPDQKYTVVDCKLEGKDNVRSVSAVNGEQAFLSGVLCGLITTGEYQDVFPMTNTDNVLCYAGGMDAPTSREGAAGFMAGAKYVNPDVEIQYTIVGGYNDPATAKEISLLGIDQGADIVTGNCGSGIMGVLEACKERGAYYIATSPLTMTRIRACAAPSKRRMCWSIMRSRPSWMGTGLQATMSSGLPMACAISALRVRSMQMGSLRNCRRLLTRSARMSLTGKSPCLLM